MHWSLKHKQTNKALPTQVGKNPILISKTKLLLFLCVFLSMAMLATSCKHSMWTSAIQRKWGCLEELDTLITAMFALCLPNQVLQLFLDNCVFTRLCTEQKAQKLTRLFQRTQNGRFSGQHPRNTRWTSLEQPSCFQRLNYQIEIHQIVSQTLLLRDGL